MDQPSVIFRRLLRYLKSLEKWGLLVVVLVLLITGIDLGAPFLDKEPPIPPLLVLVLSLIALGWVHFRLFEKLATAEVRAHVTEHSIRLDQWFDSDGERLAVRPEIAVVLDAHIDLENDSERATLIEASILSVDSEWQAIAPLADCEFRLERKPTSGPASSANPFPLKARERLSGVHIAATIRSKVPDVEKGFDYLGSLSTLVVTLGLEQPGQKPQPVRIACEPLSIQQRIVGELESRITQGQDAHGNIAQSLTQYWNAHWKAMPD